MTVMPRSMCTASSRPRAIASVQMPTRQIVNLTDLPRRSHWNTNDADFGWALMPKPRSLSSSRQPIPSSTATSSSTIKLVISGYVFRSFSSPLSK